jgi:hypothetical protein
MFGEGDLADQGIRHLRRVARAIFCFLTTRTAKPSNLAMMINILDRLSALGTEALAQFHPPRQSRPWQWRPLR